MKILFISTHNFATNPRLVKEVELALENHHRPTVLCCSFNNWSKAINEEIKNRLAGRIEYYEIPANRSPLLPWLLSSCWFNLSKFLLGFFPKNALMLSYASNKRSWLLMRELKKIKGAYDLIVAHNPGSFYPAMHFASRKKTALGIDLEDYHPGETNDRRVATQLQQLAANVLPHADYISAASPLILEYSLQDAGALGCTPFVVQNYFSSKEFVHPLAKKNDTLLLVWFSQNISYNRGLEQIIPHVAASTGIELHLFGNVNETFLQQWIVGAKNIILHSALPQKQLHNTLSQFDIGLALEPGKDLNNQLAVSNKMLAYFQAGLYILASDTAAQTQFITGHPLHGLLVTLDEEGCRSAFVKLTAEKNDIRVSAFKRKEAASTCSWEAESKKLITAWTTLRS